MKRILFVAEDVTLAHVARLLVLANALDEKKYDIFFATGSQSKYLVESTSFTYLPISTLASKLFIERLAKGERVYKRDELKAAVEADIDVIESVSPDLIVGDFRLSLSISAPLTNTSYISIVNAHWSPYSSAKIPLPEHPMTQLLGVPISSLFFALFKPIIFKYHLQVFNSLRKFYNLKPFKTLQQAYSSGDWTLYADIPELAPTRALPNHHLYLGPLIWSPDVDLPEWYETIIRQDKPIIYLTLGSSGNIKIIDLLLNVLNNQNVNIAISSANRFEKKFVSNNIFHANYLPGKKMAEIASLVICNGGSASAYQALACGTPVLGFPSNTDQHFTMNAIQQQGGGISIRSDQVTAKAVKAAIAALLTDKSYKANAIRIKQIFDLYPAADRFGQFIESMELSKPNHF